MKHLLCVECDFLSEEQRELIQGRAQAAGFEVKFAKDMSDADAAQCEVLYGRSVELVRAAGSLRWFCCANAGVEPYLRDGVFAREDCLFTNSAGTYGVTISEHIIMVLLMLMRRMCEYEKLSAAHGWGMKLAIRSIYGAHITVLGTGDIGSSFALRAKAMGARRLTGINRSGRATEGFDEVFSADCIENCLREAHVLVMALPATDKTTGILSRERIAMLPRDAYVVNVGRGSAIDEAALRTALNEGRIAGAALDVTAKEPLDPDDPLWETKNLIITPHISGNMTLEYTRQRNVEMFLEDLDNYVKGLPMKYAVDRKLGY